MATKGLILARLSPRDGDSEADLAKMVSELRVFAEAEGVPIAEVIAERNVSAWAGTAGEKSRKGRWPEVVEGLRTGRWDALVVRGLNRTARDAVETMMLLRLYAQGGWTFHAMNRDDLDDPKGSALKGLLNQWESDEKSFTIKLRWAEKASPASGKPGEYHPGRWRPFGYSYTPGSRMLVIIEDEAEIIREVAGRLRAGESAHMIALELEQRGISTVSGAQWQRNMVLRLVKPCVAGLTELNGETFPGNWPAILPMDEYLSTRAVLAASKGTRPAGGNPRVHLLAGFLSCGNCGVVLSCNGRVYQCSVKNTKAGKRGCGKVTVTKHLVEGWIVELVRTHLDRQDQRVEKAVDDTGWAAKVEAAEADVAVIQSAYQAKEIGALDWIKGLKVARAALAEVQAERTEALVSAGTGTHKWTAQHWEGMNLSQRRAVVGSVIETVVVKPTGRTGKHPGKGRIEVAWREQR